jgi:hypothetical protein
MPLFVDELAKRAGTWMMRLSQASEMACRAGWSAGKDSKRDMFDWTYRIIVVLVSIVFHAPGCILKRTHGVDSYENRPVYDISSKLETSATVVEE